VHVCVCVSECRCPVSSEFRADVHSSEPAAFKTVSDSRKEGEGKGGRVSGYPER